jgi:hypothetical protein
MVSNKQVYQPARNAREVIMKVRKPDYDFTNTNPAWCKEHPEFAQRTNLGSLSLPYLEPYLNLVMRQAQAKLGPAHPLNRDIGLFCRQEANHYLQHGAFNETMHRAGYEKAGHIEGGFFRPGYRPGTHSQDMGAGYFENGVVYVSRGEMVRMTGELFGEYIYPLVIDALYALGDIDTELDFEIAEHLFRTHREHFLLPARHEPTTRVPCAHSI